MTKQAQNAKLVLLPGLGADGRLFDPQRRGGLEVLTPPWLEPTADETLADYGRRMAATVEVDGPYVLGGVSLGGTVALEMARQLRPRCVVLIASCRSRKAIPRVLRVLAPLAGLLKPRRYKTWVPSGLGLWLLGEKVSKEDGRLLHEMLAATDPAFFKWAAQAIAQWKLRDELQMPIHHIHGSRDRLLRTRVVMPHVDRIVDGGGHMINMTHADEVNAFLREKLG